MKVGDQLLQVGDQDVSMQTVTDLRHLIIGEIGSIVEVMFKSASTGEVRIPSRKNRSQGGARAFIYWCGCL